MARRETLVLGERAATGQRLARQVRTVARVLRRNPTMALGLALLTVIVFVSALAPLLTDIDPTRLAPQDRLIAPSAGRWFGTDQVGRDVYSRTLYGGRVSLVVGISVALITMVGGAAIGLVSAYYRRLDMVVMRFMDGLMAFPAILLAIALMAMLGASLQNVIISLAVVETPRAVRVVRASGLSLREQTFVEAARALGASGPRILALHIFPNTLAPLIVQVTFICAAAVLVEAYLSFLGAGVPPDVPSWGNIMAEGRSLVERAVWVIFFPGLFLAATVLAINLLGDGLRDTLDPKLRRRL